MGVYFSKKKFTYNSAYREPFAAFVQRTDTLGLSDEALKLATSIRLGNYIRNQLAEHSGADTVIFINAIPQAANVMLRTYIPQGFNREKLWQALGRELDYVVVIDLLECSTSLRRSIFAISNRIVSERRTVRQVQLAVKVFRPSGEPIVAAINYDGDFTEPARGLFRDASQQVQALEFLDTSLNMALASIFARL